MPTPTPQLQTLNKETSTKLFNALLPALRAHFFADVGGVYSDSYRSFFDLLRDEHLNQPLIIPFEIHRSEKFLFGLFNDPYNRVYDLIEFILEHFEFFGDDKELLIERWNRIFRRDIVAYQIVDDLVVPIRTQAEAEAIESALRSPVQVARHHLSRALTELSTRPDPDCNAIIREVIDALEGFCKYHCGSDEPNLRTALRKLSDRRGVHPQLAAAMEKLSDFADAAGIRHPKPDAPLQPFEVAVFVLTICAGFVSFIDTSATQSSRDSHEGRR